MGLNPEDVLVGDIVQLVPDKTGGANQASLSHGARYYQPYEVLRIEGGHLIHKLPDGFETGWFAEYYEMVTPVHRPMSPLDMDLDDIHAAQDLVNGG